MTLKMKDKLLNLLFIAFDLLYPLFKTMRTFFIKLHNKWIFHKNNKDFLHIGYGTHFYKPAWIIGKKHIDIGIGTAFGKDLHLTAWDNSSSKKSIISIGDYCSFGAWNHITAINNIKIGNNVLTGKWVTITDNSHGSTDYLSLNSPPQITKCNFKRNNCH